MQNISLTIKDAIKTSGLTRSRIYELLGKGELEARKSGRRTLILGDSLRAYIANLPAAVISAPKRAA